MKNLRKVLAVVLVVAMAFSFAAVASAKFTDDASIKYTEAVDVLTGIGVLNGTDQGTFDPNGSLTREQAAKIIAYMLLGPTNAGLISNATSQKFSDVAQTRWSAGYIEYCANLGIIVGTGDGTFKPAGTLTTAEFTKMLLVALGYNADAEGIKGTAWAINTASVAITAGVYDAGIAISTTAACTREQAAQLAYKTLTATMVQYTGGTTITIGDSTITTGATRSEVANKLNTYTDTDSTFATVGTMQFIEKYFPNVKEVASATNDAYGRPAYTWMNGPTPIGTYKNVKPVVSWTADHTATAFDTTVATALANYTFGGTETVYTNGVPSTPAITASSDIAALTGNGTLVEVYANSSNAVTRVVVVNTVLATITAKDVDAKTVTVSDGTNSVTLSALSSPVNFGGAYAALYAKNVNDEVLLVAQDDGVSAITKILSIATPTYVTGQYTATAGGKYTVGGTAYGVSAFSIASITLGNTYTVTLDTYGYIINAGAPSTASTTYAFMVQGVKEGNALSGYTYSAQLIFADGTTKWVKMASMGGLSDATTLTAAVSIANKFVSYKEGTDGYALSDLTASTEAANATITKNSPSFNSRTVSNATVFVINTGTASAPVYTVYSGIKNVPTTIAATGYGLVSGGTYTFVLVTAVTASASTDAIFVYNIYPVSTTYVNPSLTTVTLSAIVNGVKTTVVAKDDQFGAAPTFTQGMYMGNVYTGTTVTNDGTDTSTTIVIDTAKTFAMGDANSMFKTTALTTEDVTLSNGVLTVDNGTGTITGVTDDNFVCYIVDLSDGTATAKTLSSTAYALSGTMYFNVNASGYVSYAIMVVA